MSNVGAYVELPPGDEIPEVDFNAMAIGRLDAKTPDGLEVQWERPLPDTAQVYLAWRPVVVAYWNEEEIENGNGNETESAGPNPDEEVDEEPGQPGDFVGEAPAAGPEEPQEVE